MMEPWLLLSFRVVFYCQNGNKFEISALICHMCFVYSFSSLLVAYKYVWPEACFMVLK